MKLQLLIRCRHLNLSVKAEWTAMLAYSHHHSHCPPTPLPFFWSSHPSLLHTWFKYRGACLRGPTLSLLGSFQLLLNCITRIHQLGEEFPRLTSKPTLNILVHSCAFLPSALSALHPSLPPVFCRVWGGVEPLGFLQRYLWTRNPETHPFLRLRMHCHWVTHLWPGELCW